MQFIKLLRTGYEGDEYLVEAGGVYKRSKQLKSFACGSFQDRISQRLKSLYQLQNRFILPDYMDFNSEEPLFLFPYHGEVDLKNALLENAHRIEIAMQLIDTFEMLHHISGEGFGIWGLPELLISDKLRIMPPLWVNFNKEALKFIKNRDDVFIAPEILNGGWPNSTSDVYVLGKVLEELLPGEEKEKTREILDNMTDSDPRKRPTHFSRLFMDRIGMKGDVSSLKDAVKREFSSSHIVERDRELRDFNAYLNDLKNEETSSYLIYGDTRVGKSTFLNLIQTDLRNNGWKTIMASDINQFSQELLQLTENPEYAGVNIEDFNYLWNLKEDYNLDRVARIVGKLIGIMDNVAILIDDFELLNDSYMKLLDYIQDMIIPARIVIVGVSTEEEHTFGFNRKYRLEPFNKEQSMRFLGILLGKNFIKNYSKEAEWIYKITRGYAGYIFNFLRIINSMGKLEIIDGRWKLSGDIHSLSGLDSYVKNLLANLSENERGLLSSVACLSLKFTREEFKQLVAMTGFDNIKSDEILVKFQRQGLIIKEKDNFRFALNDIWKKAYERLSPEEKKSIHKEFSVKSRDFSRRAWHYKQIDRRRAAARMYIEAARRAFKNNQGWGLVQKYFKSAYELLEKDEISPEMLMLPSFLNLVKHTTLEPGVADAFKRSRRHRFLYLLNLLEKGEHEKIPEEYHRFYGEDSNFENWNLPRFESFFVLVSSYFELGKLDKAFNLTQKVYDLIPSDIGRYVYLKILFKDLMAQYYWRKGNWNRAVAYCEQNMQKVNKMEIGFLLTKIYNTAGSMMDLHGPHYSKPILKKAVDYSEKYGTPQLALRPLLNLALSYLYSGDVGSMFDFIERARDIARAFNDKNSLALSFLIEGLFHGYNKQLEEASEDLNRALELAQSMEMQNKVKRFTIMIELMNNAGHDLSEYDSDAPYATEYGFSEVIELARTDDPERMKELFDLFKESHHLWKEEIAVAFKEKLAKHFPEEFERYLESLNLFYLRAHMKVPLALTYEAFAYLYRELGQYRKVKKFARNALDMYKKMKMTVAAETINQSLLKGEKSLEDMINEISNTLRSGKGDIKLTEQTLSKFENTLIRRFNETDILHEIINFSKTITASADPEEILREFTDWIASFIPIRKLVMAVMRNNKIMYRSSLSMASEGHEEEEELIKKMLKKKQGFIRTPFEAKVEFFIDETYKVMLYVENSKLMMSSEEFDRFATYIDNLEPIISMAIRNAISYRSSILDPLTGLYTRWYYTRRLEEEFEKSSRMQAPLSVIMADLDHFKRVNDKFGHKVGDEVLKKISNVFQEYIRNYDVIGRYGGEEFVIILPNTTDKDALEVAERVRRAVEQIDDFSFCLTISLGVSCTANKSYEKPLQLVADADRALYYSKNNGRNKVTLYDPEEN